MPRRRELHFQALLVAGASGGAQVATAVMYLLAARAIGPEAFGPVATTIAIATASAGIADFGSNALWVRNIANGTLTYLGVGRLFQWKLILTAVPSLVAAIALGAWFHAATWALAPLLAFALICSQGAAVFLIADHRSDRVAAALVADRGTSLIVFLAAYWLKLPVQWALPTSLVLGAAVGTVTLWVRTPSSHRPVATSVGKFTNPWHGTLGFAASGAATSLAQLDTAVLQLVGGPTASGSYGAVSRWTQPMGILASAVSSSGAPFMASARTVRDALIGMRKASWLLVLASVGGIAIAALAPWLVPFLLGPNFSESVVALQLLAIGTTISVWNQPCAVLLQARGRDGAVAVIRLAATILFLLGVAALGARWGSAGAAASFVILQAVTAMSFGFVLLSALAHRRARGEHSSLVKFRHRSSRGDAP